MAEKAKDEAAKPAAKKTRKRTPKVEAPAVEVQETAEVASATQEKVDALYAAIQPLLNNLKANPSKEYILWPKRLEKIEQFETYLQGIYTK